MQINENDPVINDRAKRDQVPYRYPEELQFLDEDEIDERLDKIATYLSPVAVILYLAFILTILHPIWVNAGMPVSISQLISS